MKNKTKKQTNEIPPLVLIVCFLFLILSGLLPYLQKIKIKAVKKINFSATSAASNSFFAREESIENPRKLTIEQLRKFKGLENLSDKRALEIIDGLYKASILTYNTFQNGTIQL